VLGWLGLPFACYRVTLALRLDFLPFPLLVVIDGINGFALCFVFNLAVIYCDALMWCIVMALLSMG
jgi:hypothetical protein